MPNKTQLQENNAKLSELIEILKGKGVGSGGEPEICTIKLNLTNVDHYTYWTLKNEEIVSETITVNGSTGEDVISPIKYSPVLIEFETSIPNYIIDNECAYDVPIHFSFSENLCIFDFIIINNGEIIS